MVRDVLLEGAGRVNRFGDEVIVADQSGADPLHPGERLDRGDPASGDLGRLVPFASGGTGSDEVADRVEKPLAAVLLYIERSAGKLDAIDRAVHSLFDHFQATASSATLRVATLPVQTARPPSRGALAKRSRRFGARSGRR